MPPPDMPAVSLAVSDLQLVPCGAGPTAFFAVAGRGILQPGMVIPNEWWDRPRMAHAMVVTAPVESADGLLVVAFRGRCELADAGAMQALIATGTRDAIEREVVPAVLLGMDMPARTATKGFRPSGSKHTPGVWDMDIRQVLGDNAIREVNAEIDRGTARMALAMAHHVGTPVELPPDMKPYRPHASVIHDLVRLSAGQVPHVGTPQVMAEAARLGLTTSPDFAPLMAKVEPTPEPPEPEVIRRRRPRVRVVDV